VDPAHQERAIGRRLFEELMHFVEGRPCTERSAPTTRKLITLYRKGTEQIGLRPGYYNAATHA
jgi:ribosomal protein S18 acetylase RimI-like enzyme